MIACPRFADVPRWAGRVGYEGAWVPEEPSSTWTQRPSPYRGGARSDSIVTTAERSGHMLSSTSQHLSCSKGGPRCGRVERAAFNGDAPWAGGRRGILDLRLIRLQERDPTVEGLACEVTFAGLERQSPGLLQ